MTAIAETDTTRRDERRAMSVASGAHALHDGYTDLIYVMLPIWQAEFGLTFAAVGLLRGLFAGTMAGLQIPASHLAERYGAPLILAGGTALAGLRLLPRRSVRQLRDAARRAAGRRPRRLAPSIRSLRRWWRAPFPAHAR